MDTTGSHPHSVYRSRSRLTRQRALLAAAGLGLLLLGYLIGRLQGDSAPPSPAAAAPPASQAPSPIVVSEPAPSPSATPTTEASQGGIDAYEVIQAEDAVVAQGIDAQDTEDEGGGRNVGWINNGDYLRFNDVNFGAGPATRFAARVASDVGNGITGRIEVRVDSLSNAPAGELVVGNLGGWQKWQSRTAEITPVSGKHTLYLTFACNDGTEFLNLNYFAFAQ